jgi:DNA-directed RNA polymerase specialized sigma24 family protein
MVTTNLGVVISMKELQRTVLKLRFGHGCPLEAVAQQLQLNIRSIEKLLEMALRKEFLKEINQQIL